MKRAIILIIALLCSATALSAKSFDVIIKSEPAGANVYLNGQFIGTTPLTTSLTKGSYSIELKKDGYESQYKDFQVLTKTTMAFKLEPGGPAPDPDYGKKTVYIDSNAGSSNVYLNGQYYGTTPVMLKLNEGNYNLKLTKDGYKDYNQSIYVFKNDSIKINMEKIEEYYLTVKVNVAFAKIYINNDYVGKGYVSVPLTKGQYSVKVEAQGYEEYYTSLFISKDYKLNVNLQKNETTIKINLPDYMKNYSENYVLSMMDITVDGTKVNSLSFRLKDGQHTIIIRSGIFEFRIEKYFQSGTTYIIDMNLQPAVYEEGYVTTY